MIGCDRGQKTLASRSAFCCCCVRRRRAPLPRRPRSARWRWGADFLLASGLRRRDGRRSRLRRERRNGLERGRLAAPRRPPPRTRVCQLRGTTSPMLGGPGGRPPSVACLCAGAMAPRRSWRPVCGSFCVARALSRASAALSASQSCCHRQAGPQRAIGRNADDAAEANAATRTRRSRPSVPIPAVTQFRLSPEPLETRRRGLQQGRTPAGQT
jgi:hypothetical protein